MRKFKIFVINLDRSTDRLTRIAAKFDEIGVPFERIDAYDGKTLSDAFIEQMSPQRVVKRRYYRSLSKGEVACSLSHRKAWKKIVEDDLDFAIVLEDDVDLQDNFRQVLNLVAGLPHDDWDFIKLYPLRRSGKGNIARQFEYQNHSFVIYHKFPLGCVGQAISRQGAESLIGHLPYVTQPVDSQLKSWWEAGVFPFGLIPYCVSTDVDGVSDINPSGRLEKMKQDHFIKLVNKAERALKRIWWTPRLYKKFRQFTQGLK